MNAEHSNKKDLFIEERRRSLKRLSGLCAFIVLAPALCALSGCESFSSSKKEKPSKTIDDVLSEQRPSW